MTSEKPIEVLLIEDKDSDSYLWRHSCELGSIGSYKISHVFSLNDAESYLSEKSCDIVLLDLDLSASTGIDTLIAAQRFLPDVPIIVFVGLNDDVTGMEAIQLGARDYIIKDRMMDSLLSKAIVSTIQREEIIRQQSLTFSVIEHLKDLQNIKDSIQRILKEFKSYTGFSSVVMLLKSNNSINSYYLEYDCDEESVTKVSIINNDIENKSLSSQISLYSLCDLAPSEKTGKLADNFTEQGSFWSNNFQSFIKNYKYSDMNFYLSSNSVTAKYNSLTSIPIVSGKKSIGLLQFADTGSNKLCLPDILFFEKVASLIGVALKNRNNDSKNNDKIVDPILSTICESVYIGIIVENIDTGRVMFVNDIAEEIIRQPKKEIVGQPINYYFKDDSTAQQEDNFSKKCIPFENYLQTENKQIHVLCGIKTVNLKDEVFRIHSFSNLMEKDDSQDEINKLSLFPSENPYPVLRVSTTGEVLYHNRASEELLSFMCEADGMILNASFLLIVKDCYKYKELRSQEVDCGQTIYSIFLRPIIDENYINIYGVDVTEQRRMEKQFRHSEKMRAIGLLAGGIAHEFNNQLAVINGFSELVLYFSPIQESPKHSKMLREVIKAGERAADLTRQLLTYCRHEDILLTVVDVNEVISDLQAMLSRIIGEDIQLTTTFTSNPILIEIDKGQLGDVLVNLCANARDAMPRGGKISITTENGSWDKEVIQGDGSSLFGSYIRIIVSDTGHGMDEDTLKRIYEPFFTTKPLGKGTGLGLAMVYSVINDCGGTIEVASEINKGTSFNICLPETVKKSEVNTERVFEKEEPFITSNETILVVEDESGVLLYVSTVLEAAGYTVLQSSNPIEAMEIFDNNIDSISLVLSDVIMPEISGFKLINALREKKPDVKAICMSGYSYDMITERSNLEDDIVIIKKPVRPPALLSAVKKVFEK